MTKLKKLYLDNNQLTKLPHELHKIGNTLVSGQGSHNYYYMQAAHSAPLF